MADINIEGTSFLNIDEYHYENSYKRLCPSPGGKLDKDALFPTMAHLLTWSAILGYKNKCPKPIKKRYPSPPVRWQYIKPDHQLLLVMLALENETNFEVLKSPDKIKANIESHSNGGLDLMQQSLALDPLAYQSMESLMNEIIERTQQKGEL